MPLTLDVKPDRFTFPHSESGLRHALYTTLTNRRAGKRTIFRTYIHRVGDMEFGLLTVLAFPKVRPNRRARGCSL
jgi:hypothetical protein